MIAFEELKKISSKFLLDVSCNMLDEFGQKFHRKFSILAMNDAHREQFFFGFQTKFRRLGKKIEIN